MSSISKASAHMKNRKPIYILFALTAVLAFGVATARQGQSLFGDQKPRRTFNEQQNVARTVPHAGRVATAAAKGKTAPSAPKDTAFYLALTKRFGWYYGIGPQLTKAEAGQVPCCFRLTEKDSLGHYTKIEAVTGSGLYTKEHGLETYLSEGNTTPSGADGDDMAALIRNVVQWRLYPSADNRSPSMESGYDAAGNQIYTYILTQFNDTISIGHYVDSFGEPISLVPGDDVARYVQVTYDTPGYERRIQYLNDGAFFRRNTDGAYMLRKNYDAAGNIVLAISCAMNGIPVKDDWGNCGWMGTYNDRGQLLSKTYVDENLRPMKMPARRTGSTDVMTRRYEYDDRHCLKQESYFMDNGDRDSTKDGVHAVRHRYDGRGNLLTVTTWDMDGKLCGNGDEIAVTEYTYTADGELLSTLYRDKNGMLKNDAADVCLYQGKNRYRTVNGVDTVPVYTETVSDSCTITTDYKNGLVHIVKTDDEGRETESAYYNTDMEPKERDGFFRRTSLYRKAGNQEIQETKIYSQRGTQRIVTTTDLKERTRIQQTFDGNDVLMSSFGQTLGEDMETVTGQYGFDAMGNIARSHLEDALYYKVKSGTTYRGATSYMAGKNEYDEPSYVAESESFSSRIYCTKLFDSNGSVTLLDEDNREINDVRTFRDSLNRAYCIEVMTPRALELGLRSGDLIVRYGEFYYAEPVCDKWKPADWLQIETYLTRKSAKDVLLLRYFPEDKSHRLVSLTLPEGTVEDLGFIIQTVYFTKAETERYKTAVDNYLAARHIDRTDFVTDPTHYGNQPVCLIRPFKVSTSEMISWRQGLRHDAIYLGFVNRLSDGKRNYIGLSDGFSEMWDKCDAECDSTTVFYTVDGSSVRQVTLPGRNSAVSISTEYLPEDEYKSLLQLENTIRPDTMGVGLYDIISDLSTDYTPEQAHEYLRKHTSLSVDLHVTKGDSMYSEILKLTSGDNNFGIFDFSKTDELYILGFPEDNDGQRLATRVLEGIDFSAYRKLDVNETTGYVKWSSDDESRASQIVLYKPLIFLMIFNGDFRADFSE